MVSKKSVQPSISHFFQSPGKKNEKSEPKVVDLTDEPEPAENTVKEPKKRASEPDLEAPPRKRIQALQESDIPTSKSQIDDFELVDAPQPAEGTSLATNVAEAAAKLRAKDKPKPTSKAKPKAKASSESKSKASSSKTSKTSKLTPLEKQILELKAANPDKLLLIQVGYKYKLFGEDARIGASILNIMFIGDSGDRADFSYCSFPDFKLHINLKRLLTHGHKIGVVKQMESAAVNAVEKGSRSDVMVRELTAVYTRGTYLEDEFISNGKNVSEEESFGYIICILETKNSKKTEFSVLGIQPSTGEIVHDTFTDGVSLNQLETRLVYLNPSEIIYLNSEEDVSPQMTKIFRSVNPDVLIMNKKTPSVESATAHIKQFFSNQNYHHLFDYYTINFGHSIQICVSQMIGYLEEFKLSTIFTIPSNIVAFKDPKQYMILPSNTIQSLEIFHNSTDANSGRGTLVWLLDHTRTKSGRRLLTKWISKPLVNQQDITDRLSSIEDLTGDFNHLVDSFKGLLDKVGRSVNLEQLLIKIHYSCAYKTSKVTRYEVYTLLETFSSVIALTKRFEKQILAIDSTLKSPLLTGIFKSLLNDYASQDLVADLLSMINTASLLDENSEEHKTNFFNLNYKNWEGISREMEEIASVENELESELEAIKIQLGRPQLKYITSNKEPYLIEIRNGKQVDSLPANFHRISGTLTVSRFRTAEASRLYKLLKYHQEMLMNNCDQAFHEFLAQIDENYRYFSGVINLLSQFDCLLSLAAASSIRPGYTKPTIVSEQTIDIVESRNPIIENLTQTYVPNNISLSYNKDRVLILTGPNMGGKSSYVKQIALMSIMAQIGCYLPCKSANIGIFDSVFLRMGSKDNILKGTSTFMTEMLECKDIFNGMTSKSLIILDEVGRGTSTGDGISIAYAILRYLIESSLKPIVLFITHYPSLHSLEHSYPNEVTNYHMGYQEIYQKNQQFPQIVFLYSLVRGEVNNSYGLNVAKLADLPSSIISNAFETSEKLKDQIETEELERFILQTVGILKDVKEAKETSATLDTLKRLVEQ